MFRPVQALLQDDRGDGAAIVSPTTQIAGCLHERHRALYFCRVKRHSDRLSGDSGCELKPEESGHTGAASQRIARSSLSMSMLRLLEYTLRLIAAGQSGVGVDQSDPGAARRISIFLVAVATTASAAAAKDPRTTRASGTSYSRSWSSRSKTTIMLASFAARRTRRRA